MKNLTLLSLLFFSISAGAQRVQKQEFGINAAGLFVKNQATVAPSFIYRYKINNFQLRAQLAFDCRVTNENRDGFTKTQQTTFVQARDTNFDYEPAKNNTIGLILGYQKNQSFENSAFKYFYGVDIIYMYKEYERRGAGNTKLVSGTTTQSTDLSTLSKNKLKTMGVGIPVGISYFWDDKFFASLEAKFVMAYQEGSATLSTESNQTNPNLPTQSTVIASGGTTTTSGFDVGLKPITGLCFGIVF